MNKNIIKSLLTFAAAALMCAGCEVDDYNENYLDGWEPSSGITDVQNITLALTDDDYAAIANNATNKSIASASGEDATKALKAIGTNKYFATTADAAAYIPAYLAANYITLDDNSTALVTYTCALDLPEKLVAMNAMKEIAPDYTKIWGEGTEIEYLTPATESKLTDALPTEGLEVGDYVAVTYKYAETEPTTGGGTEPEPEPAKPELTSVLGTAALDAAVEVTGYISALSSQGPILTDKGGSVLLYGNKATSHLKLGEIVKVSGKISQYNNGYQIAADDATIEQTNQSEAIAYPTPTELDGAALDGLLTTYYNEYHYAQFVKVKGTVSISTSGSRTNYNFNVAGATTAVGSFYGITEAVKGKIEDGKEATLYGYLSSISKSSGSPKYVNVIVTHVNEAPTVAAPAALAMNTRADVATEKRYAIYSWDGTKFTASNDAVLQPSDYTAMGQKYGNFTDPDQDIYLPQFLAANFPYGKEKDVKNVSYLRYKDKKTSWATDEYVHNGTAWVKASYFETREDSFRKTNKNWKYDPTLELNFLTDGTAEFKAFCQYCANWVYDNIDVKLGAPARDKAGDILSTDAITINGAKPAGNYFVSSYGNNEWFAGSYAFYGEMKWSASEAKASYENARATIKEKGIDLEIGVPLEGTLTNSDLVKAMQQNAAVVFQNVLHYMYPDITTDNYSKVVINVYNYFSQSADGVEKGVYTYTFEVVPDKKGEFKYKEGTFAFLN